MAWSRSSDLSCLYGNMVYIRDNNCAAHQKRHIRTSRQSASKHFLISSSAFESTIRTFYQINCKSCTLTSFAFHIFLCHQDKTIDDNTHKNQIFLSCACICHLKYSRTSLLVSCSTSSLHIESSCRPHCSLFHNFHLS